MKRLSLSLVIIFASFAQASPTTITDVLHQPYNSLPAAGVDITITQTAFFSGANYFPAWSVTIHPVTDASGNLSVQLEPNPAGQPYSVILTYPNGIITKEFWNVPASVTPLTISQVLTTVGPVPPLGLVQLGQLAQGGAATGNFLGWNGVAWGPNTAPLPVPQGGTGDASLAAHGPLIGGGPGPVVAGSPGTAGQVWTSNGPNADPTFQAAAAGSRTDVQNFTLVANSGGVLSFLGAETTQAINFPNATGPNSIAYHQLGIYGLVNDWFYVRKTASSTWSAAAGTVDLALTAGNFDGTPAAGNWNLNFYVGCAAPLNGTMSFGAATTVTAVPPSASGQYTKYRANALNLPAACAANSPMEFWLQRVADTGGTTGIRVFSVSMEVVIRGN